MNKVIIIISILLIGGLLITGCATSEKVNINSQEDAGAIITNVSSGVDDVSGKLEDINNKLG